MCIRDRSWPEQIPGPARVKRRSSLEFGPRTALGGGRSRAWIARDDTPGREALGAGRSTGGEGLVFSSAQKRAIKGLHPTALRAEGEAHGVRQSGLASGYEEALAWETALLKSTNGATVRSLSINARIEKGPLPHPFGLGSSQNPEDNGRHCSSNPET